MKKIFTSVDIGSDTVGLITYMRTDSIRLSDDFVKPAMKYIEENYGKKYLGYVKKSKKTENVQDAHEGIRPTSVLREPLKIKEYLNNDEYKLYSLIYKRTIASLMADAKVNQTTIIFDNNDYNYIFSFCQQKRLFRVLNFNQKPLLPIFAFTIFGI